MNNIFFMMVKLGKIVCVLCIDFELVLMSNKGVVVVIIFIEMFVSIFLIIVVVENVGA